MILSILADPLISLPIIGLSGISLFLLAGNAPSLFFPQANFFLIGIVLFILVSKIDFRIWPKFIWLIYILSVAFLGISFFTSEVRGTNRWIYIGTVGLQPSELIKPFIIIIFAYLLSKKPQNNLSHFLKPVLLFLPFIIIIFKQPDLGNVLVYLTIFISLEIMSGLPWKYILVCLAGFFIFMPFSWHILKDYQKQRIISFLNPQSDPIGAGYNALQAMIAIGSGQFTGLGLGKGTQSRLLFLPEYHTDFVFATTGEAFGFLGGALLIIFYLLLLIRILMVAKTSDDHYGKLLTIGIFTQFFSQVFINIGMNLGILPITGITLPLVSYGGSSIISTFIALGLVESIRKLNKKSPLVLR